MRILAAGVKRILDMAAAARRAGAGRSGSTPC